MSFSHYPTDEFIKQAKEIKRVYPSFGDDLKQMRGDIDKLSSFKEQSHIDDIVELIAETGTGINKWPTENHFIFEMASKYFRQNGVRFYELRLRLLDYLLPIGGLHHG